MISGQAVYEFYNSEKYRGNELEGENAVGPTPYSYTVTDVYTFTGWQVMDTLTVNNGATLNIATGVEENNSFPSAIEANHVNVQGSITIEASQEPCSEPNRLVICGGGTLTGTNEGSIIGAGDSILELRENVVVSGLTLYECGENNSLTVFTHGDATECYSYDSNESKWVRQQNNGPEKEYRYDEEGVSNGTYANEGDQTLSENAYWRVEGAQVTFNTLTMQQNAFLEIRNFSDAETIHYGKITYTSLVASQGAVLAFETKENIPEQIKSSLYDDQGNQLGSIDQINGFCEFEYDGTSKWVMRQNGSQEPALEDNKYTVRFDSCDFEGNPQASVKVSEESLTNRNSYPFTANSPLIFTLTPPEYRRGQIPVVEIRQDDTFYSSTASVENEKLNVSKNSDDTYQFTFIPTSEKGFEVEIWWSEYDRFGPGEGEVCFEIASDEANTVTLSQATEKTMADPTNSNCNKYIYDLSSFSTLTMTVTVPDGKTLDKNASRFGEYGSGNSLIKDTEIPEPTNNQYQISITNDKISNTNEDFFFFEIRFKGGEVGGGDDPNNPGTDDPGQGSDITIEQARDLIVAHEYAYHASTADELKKYLAREIYYEFIGAGPYQNSFEKLDLGITGDNDSAKIESIKEKITIDSAQKSAADAVNLPYYEYSYELQAAGEGTSKVEAKGKVYYLNSDKQYIVKTGNTYNVVTIKKTGSDADDSYIMGDGDVKVFGNGASIVGSLETGSSHAEAYHITQEHSGFGGDGFFPGVANRLIVCDTGFKGARIVGAKSAAAWDFQQSGIYGADKPADIYYGNDQITINSIAFDNLQNDSKHTILAVSVDTTKAKADVANITNNGNGFTVFFATAYDEIPLKITYGDNSTGVIDIHRVGLHISKNHIESGKIDVMHGTDHTSNYSVPQSAGEAVYASFYAPNAASASGVQLFVTITKSNGTVERKIVNTTLGTGTASQGTDKGYADFLLWSGTETEYNSLQKIEAIVFAPGSEDSFGGVKVGSGSGVVWTK